MTRIVLTHAHFDHAGGAAHRRTGAPVQVRTDDAGYLARGEPPPVTSATAPKGLARWLRRIPDLAFEPVENPVAFTGGDLLPVAGGLRVVFSPGGLCSDPEQNRDAARRLADLEYRTAAFTHGPEIRDTGRDAIRNFLRRRGG